LCTKSIKEAGRADLPVEQQTMFDFAINLRQQRRWASRCAPLLAGATEVIE
jgi:hypothetical protein